jgi:hypothetical protein
MSIILCYAILNEAACHRQAERSEESLNPVFFHFPKPLINKAGILPACSRQALRSELAA